MNNKPVAWMAHDNSGASLKCTDEFCIPLYTNPAKTLTDEEIDDISDYEYLNYPANDELRKVRRSFARAILRKAQEK